MQFETQYPGHADAMLALSAVPTLKTATNAERAKVGWVLAGAAAKWRLGEPGDSPRVMLGAEADAGDAIVCDSDHAAATLATQVRQHLVAEQMKVATFAAGAPGTEAEAANPERRKAILRGLAALAKYLLPLLI